MNSVPQSVKHTTLRQGSGVFLSLLGTAAIVGLTFWIGQQQAEDLGRYFVYQAAGLVVALVVALGVATLNGRGYLRWGSLNSGSRQIRFLGVPTGESWKRVGLTFTVTISLVTAAFLALAYWSQLGSVAPRSWATALVVAIPLSATNAFTEEIVTRWAVVQSLSGRSARFAPWASALIFGSVHYFGIPGGPVGALMAGFLAWLLARSIQDIGGFGWAWIVHFCQDILIFTVTIALFI